MTIRVAINGFGRIGRQVFKIIHQHYADELRISHIGVSNPHATENRALLLKYDSNYGVFDADVQANVRGGKNSIVVDGQETQIISRNPYGPVPEWARLGVDLVIEASGHFKGRGHLHLTGGARRVIVTAPDPEADLLFIQADPDDAAVVEAAGDRPIYVWRDGRLLPVRPPADPGKIEALGAGAHAPRNFAKENQKPRGGDRQVLAYPMERPAS